MMRSMRLFAWFSITVLAAACGSVSNKLPDADDVQIDAAPDARTTGTITVNVMTDYGDVDSNGNQLPVGLPRQGAQVFFIEADGTTTMVTTGGDGVARSGDVHAGTTALVHRPQSATEAALEVFFALDPGAEITAGPDVDTYVSTTTIGTMTVTTPAIAGATGYYVTVGCGYGSSSTPTITVTIYDPCDRTDRTLVAVAYDSTGTRGYSTRQVDLAPGTTVNMTAFQNPSTFVMNMSSIPAAVTYANVYGQTFDADAGIGSFSMASDVTGGAAVLQGQAILAGSETLIESYFSDGMSNSSRQYRRITGTPTTAQLDVSRLLPFTRFDFGWDPANLVVDWDESGTTNVADIMITRGSYSLAATGGFVRFALFGPHVTSELTMPELPTELRNLLPQAGDNGYVQSIHLIDDEAAADYQAIVPHADANSRFYQYRGSENVWISGGNFD
jgi:hypothetical protein